MFRRSPALTVALVIASIAACSKTRFSGSGEDKKNHSPAPARPGPNETDDSGQATPTPTEQPPNPTPTTGPEATPTPETGPTPTPTPAVKPTIPPDQKTPLELSLVNLNHEAWYLNCFTISLANFQTEPVRFCNKNTPSRLPALTVHRSQCNVLQFEVTTTFPIADSCHQISPHNWQCSYPNKVDRRRITSQPADRGFFEIFDATRAGDITLLPAFRHLVRPVEGTASATNSALPEGFTRSTRVYFEDLSNAQMASYQGGGYLTERPDNRTIDFDDMVFDIRAKNANFTVEGANSWWSPQGDSAPVENRIAPPCDD